MSKLNYQRFETRPVRAFAVQWDGTKKHAKKIIDDLAEYGVIGSWNENYTGLVKEDITVPTEETSFYLRVPKLRDHFPVQPNWWIIRHGKDDFVVLTPEKFEENYRVPKEGI